MLELFFRIYHFLLRLNTGAQPTKLVCACVADLDRTSDSSQLSQFIADINKIQGQPRGSVDFIKLTRFHLSFAGDFERKLAPQSTVRAEFLSEECCCRNRVDMEGENIFLFVPNLIGIITTKTCLPIIYCALCRLLRCIYRFMLHIPSQSSYKSKKMSTCSPNLTLDRWIYLQNSSVHENKLLIFAIPAHVRTTLTPHLFAVGVHSRLLITDL
jgi:hypothetical protein